MTFLIRADAGMETGTGHAMRCLSLAHEAVRRGHSVTFAMAETVPAIEDRIRDAGCRFFRLPSLVGSKDDAAETARAASGRGADWVIVDGYRFGSDYQRWLKHAGVRALFLDDYGHAGTYSADIVLNQNISARGEWYADRAPHTRLLLGPAYALLRPDFLPFGDRERDIPDVARRILVSLGGGDPRNVTAKVLSALESVESEHLEVTVVVGGANPHVGDIRERAASSRHRVTVVVDAKNMPELMAGHDLAVAAAGTTAYELLFTGLPFVTGAFAPNQVAMASALGDQGLALNVGRYGDVSVRELADAISALMHSAPLRLERSRKGMEIVDGMGALRVLDAVESVSRP